MTGAEAVALVEQLAPACRKYGVRRVRVGEVELEFQFDDVDGGEVKKFQQFMEQGVPTDDEALNWSAPGYVPPPAPDAPPQGRGRRRS